MANIYS